MTNLKFTTQKTPIQLLLGYERKGGADAALQDEVKEVTTVWIDVMEERVKVAEKITRAQERRKQHFDRKRKKPETIRKEI